MGNENRQQKPRRTTLAIRVADSCGRTTLAIRFGR